MTTNYLIVYTVGIATDAAITTAAFIVFMRYVFKAADDDDKNNPWRRK